MKTFSVPINGKPVRMTIEAGRELYLCLDRLFGDGRDDPGDSGAKVDATKGKGSCNMMGRRI